MLTDEQIEAVHKALDEMEMERDGILDLSQADQMRELCMRAGLPEEVMEMAVRDLQDRLH